MRSEEGWAFENQLWGGVPVTAPELDPKNGFPPVINWLQQWPFPTATPRPYYRSNTPIHGENEECGWPIWLLDPPPTMVRRVTALPVAMMSRLYNEGFWSVDVAKYSHQALKFPVHEWAGRPLRSSFYLSFTPRRDLLRAFRSRAAWPWLSRSVSMLGQVGEDVLSEYIYRRAMGTAGPAVTRRRLHYERRRWRHSDAAIAARSREVTRLRDASRALLAGYQTADSPADGAAALGAYLDHARLLVAEALELARLAGWEVSALQLLVSECARLDDVGRRVVQGHMDGAGARVERMLKPAVDGAAAEVEGLQRELADVIPGLPPVGAADSLRLTIAEKTSAAASVLSAARGMVHELGRSVDTVGGFSSVQSARDKSVRSAFNLLVDTASGRRQWQTLERLAEHRLRELPGNSPIRRVVTACMRILEAVLGKAQDFVRVLSKYEVRLPGKIPLTRTGYEK
ncbi:hypothetical protein FJTKL_06891 [Diaporthe vaccinii]|uniref:Uncharacterized protein n=1 Tax=Diaporthe vaccinii TaxID=105482 RepID=A0ABR4EVR7_9PEZI